MAAAAPASLFPPLATAWRHLALRSDVDDIILELLGRFSLERVYAGGRDKETYQHLVITLLAQLNTIFYIQRLTLPAENLLVGWYLGFIVSWEVTIRSVEFVLQVVAEGRESLWENRPLRDKYLANFLLSALRIVTLHPRAPANQRSKDRRDRFARIHRSLEQVFDSYPGPKSSLLVVCKEITNQLHVDPTVLSLPQKLRYELPNLATQLYPLPECLLPTSISELVPHENDFDFGWLPRFLALRDVSHFVVGASIQYAANRETRDVHLQSSSARSRNAVLSAVDRLRIPPHLPKRDLVATFSRSFRIILPDTLDVSVQNSPEMLNEEYELDALETLCARLSERQVIHRVSDMELMQNMSEVMKGIFLQDDPSGQSRPIRPALYAVNCPGCHLAGGSQMRSLNMEVPSRPGEEPDIELPPKSKCIYCGEPITAMREVALVRRTWELLRPLEPDADTINVERHLPTRFQMLAPKVDVSGLMSMEPEQSSPRVVSPTRLLGSNHPQDTTLLEPVRSDSSTYLTNMKTSDDSQVFNHAQQELYVPTEPPPFSPVSHTHRRPSQQSSILSPIEPGSLPTSRTVPVTTPPEKRKTGWRSKFTTVRKPSAGASGDTSSLSSTTLESQKLEEISLGALSSARKASGRGKNSKNINVVLSQCSTYALFWTQLLIQIWDVSTSPPTMARTISTESTCILATVGKMHLAYIIGTRDQKLTLRIVNLVQPSAQVVEYRIPSTLWCKCIAIDRQENFVVVGFENSVVRFFKTTNMEQPREDRLHSLYHQDCKGCPSVETLVFSADGLALLASTRHPKSGIIQIYNWRFPFTSFQELTSCRYLVPLHESEDNGISSAILRSGSDGEDNLICLTTWTQSGTPVLLQPQDGHRSDIKTEPSSRHGKLGNRIQCAAFSPSGRELAMVNDKGYLYHISSLNSSPMDIRRIATSKELTAKSDSFSMSFMTLSDEEHLVLGWADSSKATGWIKKIPIMARGHIMTPETPSLVYTTPSTFQGDRKDAPPQPPVELAASEPDVSNKMPGKSFGLFEHRFS